MKRLLCLALLFLVPTASLGDDVYHVIIKKQKEKVKYRWSIEQWFETRDKMRLQDLWFALHAPSPYEFYFGADYQFARLSGAQTNNDESVRLMFAAYAKIFGLEVQSNLRAGHILAQAHMRIFGYHAQGTNLTFSAGIRSIENPVRYHNPFVGLSLALYVTRYVGAEAWYRYYLGSLSNTASIVTTGNYFEANGFIDFSWVRIFAGAFQEVEHVSTGNPGNLNNRWGFHLGTKLFF